MCVSVYLLPDLGSKSSQDFPTNILAALHDMSDTLETIGECSECSFSNETLIGERNGRFYCLVGMKGKEVEGKERKLSGRKGKEMKGRKGKEVQGKERNWKERKGKERKWKERRGKERKGDGWLLFECQSQWGGFHMPPEGDKTEINKQTVRLEV